VGDDGVIVDESRLLAYESDALTIYRHRPLAVVLPRGTEEVAAVMRLARDAELPVVPRGAGTGLSGGALSIQPSLVLATPRMNQILHLDPSNRIARLQPGVVNSNISVAAEPHGLMYAPDPSSQAACSIGGNVAENAGGPHCLKYGVTSRYITGLTVVTYEGETLQLGGFVKEVPGFDLVGLFVGSEGCFGVATEIEVRLSPIPEGVRTLLAIFDSLEDSGTAVSDIIASGLLPAALEIIDGATIRAVEASVFAAGYPVDAQASLVAEFDGVEAGLDEEVRRAIECCTAAGATEVRTADTEEERAGLWQGRKKAFGAMGRIAPDLIVQDATVPRTKLPEVLRQVTEIGERYDLRIATVCHAGDGNLHPNILFDRRDAEESERVESASEEILAACVAVGGTITGEHGVGFDKLHHMKLVHTEVELAAMRAVQHVWDPHGGMNPGKVVPAAPDGASV